MDEDKWLGRLVVEYLVKGFDHSTVTVGATWFPGFRTLTCMECSITSKGNVAYLTTNPMLEHLERHIDAGDIVPSKYWTEIQTDDWPESNVARGLSIMITDDGPTICTMEEAKSGRTS